MFSIYNKHYERVGILSNDAEEGIHFYDDELSTSIVGGLHTLSLKVPKFSGNISALADGNYIERWTPHGQQLLLTIARSTENSSEKIVYCEDATIQALNSFVDAMETPVAPEPIEYYLNFALERVDIDLRINESSEAKILDFSSHQRALERVLEIATGFDMEVRFSVDFTPGTKPKRYLDILQKRVDDSPGFRVSSDDLLEGIERQSDITNIITRLTVRGSSLESEGDESSEGGGSSDERISQPVARRYDNSKSSGATNVSTRGWNTGWVDQFNMNQADPPYVNGKYIDDFLRKYYPDSPLIGQGDVIKQASDYYGIAVGSAMGVWAKETTFGRGHPGAVDHNYGCIRWTPGSGYSAVTYGGSRWNKYPSKRIGIMEWFKLIRYNYVETGQVSYRDFLNKYSPTFENDHSTFKNLMWGVLKSFGYDSSDTTSKKNYSTRGEDINKVNLRTPRSGSGGGGNNAPTVDNYAEKAIARAEEIATWRRRYQWGGNGNPSWDCSGYMQEVWEHALGRKITSTSWPRATTYSMWAQDGLFRRIPRGELKRGDLIMYDTGYTSAIPNHVGLYLGPELGSPNSVIHAGDPVGIKQPANSMPIIGYVRVEH